MALNYTVSTATSEAVTGTQVNLTYPIAYLTITPDPGYTVTATDFSIGAALPSYVTSVTFTQSGANILVSVVLDNSFIMPSADVSIPIDIDGVANRIQYSIAGTYDLSTTNTNLTSSTGNVYSGSGDINDIVTLFTLTLTADADHIFEIDPQAVVSSLNTLPDNYTITRADTYTGSDLTQVIWTVKYTITAANITGDTLLFTADAIEQIVVGESGLPKYYSYIFYDFGPQDASGDYYKDYSVQSHVLQVFGDVGAKITIDMVTNADPPVNLFTNEVITSTAGYKKLVLNFPVVTSDTTYTITLSGDISTTFTQPNPIIVHAAAGINTTLTHTPLAGYTVTRTGTYTTVGAEGFVSLADQVNTTFTTIFEITADDGSNIALLKTPTWDDISNTDETLNGGTSLIFSPNLVISGSGTNKITIEATATVTKFGNVDVTFYLSLVGLFNINPVAVNDTATVTKGGNVLIDVLANDTDADGHTLTPVIITQPTYGTAVIEGTKIRYTHDNTANYTDSFTYAANDGYINGNTATVDMVVGLAPGDSLALSATDGVFYVPVVLGDGAGTFTVHFDAGSTADRIELIYEGNVVADSLFIGDYLTDGNRASSITTITGTTSLDSFDYVGSGGDGSSYGQTAAWNLKVAGNTVAYADPTDIAPTGNVRGVTSNYGGQVGVGDLVYTSISDVVGTTGLDSADGNASISYTKASGGSSNLTIKITGISGTGWSIYQTDFS